MPHPFLPMTNEILKKLSNGIKDLILAAKSPEPQLVLVTENAKPITDSNPPSPEIIHRNLRTNNRY